MIGKQTDKSAKRKKGFRLSAMRNSLMLKMILSTSLLIILVAGVLTILSTYQSKKAITVEIEKQLEYQLESVTQSITVKQQGILHEISLISSMSIIRDGIRLRNGSAIKQFLYDYVETQPYLENAYVLDPRGIVMYDVLSSQGQNFSNRDYFKASIEGKEHISEVIISGFTGDPVQVISYPIRDESETVIGVLAACIKFDVFTKILNNVELLEGSSAYLLDREGIVIYHSGGEEYENKNIREFKIPQLTEKADHMTSGGEGKVIYNHKGKMKLNLYRPVGNWSLSINAVQSVYLQPVKRMQANLLLSAIIFTLIGLAVGVFNSMRMVNKITRMKNALETASKGDLTIAVNEGKLKKCWEVMKCSEEACPAYGNDNLKCWDIPETLCGGEKQESITSKIDKCIACKTYTVSEGDELHQISRSLNTMVSSIKAMIMDIKKVSLELAASSQQLSTASEESSVAAEEIARSMTSISEGAELQVTNVSEANQLVEQMNSYLDKSSRATKQMSEKASNVQETSNKEQKVISKTIDHINSIKSSSEQTVKVMESLNTQSDEIGNINEVITQLAEQTNLLALNAAIEAARAGEQGKGFAVVAEEIRKLAFQSGESAKGIQKLILEIQSEIAAANRLILEENEKVDIGIESVKESEKAFHVINENIGEVGRYIEDVVNLIEETKGSSTRVSQAVGNIIEVVSESAAGAQQVTATTEEQTSTSEEIAKSADQLASMADKLLESISSFRTEG